MIDEHVGAVLVIAATTALLVILARRRQGSWTRVLAVVLVADEVSWWVFVANGGVPGASLAYSLPLQLCDIAILIAAAALWTRNQLLVEVTYFWGLAGTIQALFTPDLPQHFPSFQYFQYYIAHGGVVCAALVLVAGFRLYPRPWAVARVMALSVAYAVLVGLVDLLTGANYMYLRAKPAAHTLLDLLGPWPIYIAVATAIAFVLFAVLYSPFFLWRRAHTRS